MGWRTSICAAKWAFRTTFIASVHLLTVYTCTLVFKIPIQCNEKLCTLAPSTCGNHLQELRRLSEPSAHYREAAYPMNIFEKLVQDPECGPRSRSPIVRALLGLLFLFEFFLTMLHGAIRVSKAGNGEYIHFSDHPKTYVLICILSFGTGVLLLLNARTRYLMHGD